MMNKSRELQKKLELNITKLAIIENKSLYNKEDIYYLNNLIAKFNLGKKYQIFSDKVYNPLDNVYLSITDLANILSITLIRMSNDAYQKRNLENLLTI